jgi:nitrous oxide reductase accessory protein NosL
MPRLAPSLPLPPAALAAAVLVVVAAGCGGAETGPPALALDRSTCAACGMLISDPAFAGGYRVGSSTAVFDDIGCLLRRVDHEGLAAAPGLEVWFLDAEGKWFPAAEAAFVYSTELETPMAGHIQAFADRSRAESTASQIGGELISDFDRLRARAGETARAQGDHDGPSG